MASSFRNVLRTSLGSHEVFGRAHALATNGIGVVLRFTYFSLLESLSLHVTSVHVQEKTRPFRRSGTFRLHAF